MTRISFVCVLLIAMLVGMVAPSGAIVPPGWEKVSGQPFLYSGVPDGLDTYGDRQNSYAWSMEVLGDYLYVGTNRNVVGSFLEELMPPDQPWPSVVPSPDDRDDRSRIYRMGLKTGVWELYYLADPTQTEPYITGPDEGYRMMKTYTTRASGPVLYVGTMGDFGCKLLAITPDADSPMSVFQANVPVPLPLGFSIRAIAEHNRQLFWASDVLDLAHGRMLPRIWYASDPLAEYTANSEIAFPSIDVPTDWFPKGAEIMDMLSYNGALYVFFLPHDFTPENMGFWVGKLKQIKGVWQWQLVVGDLNKGAKYPPGLGDIMNGGATAPTLFNGDVYVGTGSSTMVQFFVTGRIDIMPVDPLTVGAKIYRFNRQDVWERVEPPAFLNDGRLNGFANPLNQYVWRMAVQNGKLYAATFDARTLVDQLAPLFPEYSAYLDMIPYLLNPAGFDLYSTTDGVIWLPESLDGFCDEFNYGGRSFATDPKTGDLFLGTANPFYGCQVWRKMSTK